MSSVKELNKLGNELDSKRDKLRNKGLSAEEVNRIMLQEYRRYWALQKSFLKRKENNMIE